MKRETTPIEHTAIGAFAGLVEVTVMQPTVALKNALQVRIRFCMTVHVLPYIKVFRYRLGIFWSRLVW